MATLLTQPEVIKLCRAVGFTAANSKIASAISMCEAPYRVGEVAHSNFSAIGDQKLANDIWGYSYGGFQIRSLRKEKGTGGIRDEDRLLDPTFNARSARAIKRAAGSFRPWSTFTSGIYKAYLQDDFPPPPGTYVVVDGDTLSGIALKLGGTFSWLDLANMNGVKAPSFRIYVGQVLLLPAVKIGA